MSHMNATKVTSKAVTRKSDRRTVLGRLVVDVDPVSRRVWDELALGICLDELLAL